MNAFTLIVFFKETVIFHKNSVDPDQILHSAGSELGLHCLYMSPKRALGLNLAVFSVLHCGR